MENIQTLFVIIAVVCLFGSVPLLGALMPRDDKRFLKSKAAKK